ncbi:MAG: type II toxin-antitoxin system ParD family antitoxin [Alphaproteobacteria bacterium]|nr:type II toxin-antitoxin system ParD family antitoxin [Alphaproteobacteria bacterium]
MKVSIALTPELVEMIEARVKSGRYASSGEVVREALRLLERFDRWDADEVERLRSAWNEGLASGDAGSLGFAELKAEARRRWIAEKRGT